MTTSNRTWRWRLFLWLHVADLLRDSYLGLLGREPDPAGLDAYGAELARTHNFGELLTDIAHSDEFWEKIVAVRSPELVYAAFRGLLGREPDKEAATTYAAMLAGKKEISAVLEDLIGSDEFWEKMQARRSPELVDAAFRGLLGREPDTEAAARYAEVLTEKKDISIVLADIVRSDEFWGKMLASRSPELVDSTFQTLLGREPDKEAAAAYAAMLAGKKEISAVLEDVIGSDEFWKKMQAHRSPELVDAAFRGLLGRGPDSEASASYAEVLTDKKDISVVLADIARSDEFWGKMLASRSTELVDSTFRTLLGREPDKESAAAYAAMLAGKKEISAVLEDIIGSDEFWKKMQVRRSPELVDAAFRGLLGREPDTEAAAGYAEVLSGEKDISVVLDDIIGSDEFWKKMRARRSIELVGEIYKGLLGGEPEQEAAQAYGAILSGDRGMSAVLADIIGTDAVHGKDNGRPFPSVCRGDLSLPARKEPRPERNGQICATFRHNKELVWCSFLHNRFRGIRQSL